MVCQFAELVPEVAFTFTVSNVFLKVLGDKVAIGVLVLKTHCPVTAAQNLGDYELIR